MSLIRKNELMPVTFRNIFDDFFGHNLFEPGNNFSDTGTTIPSVNILENADNFEVRMAAPGMNKDDFKVELNGNLLTIKSEKECNHTSEEKGYSRREFSYQSFQRSFQLPKDVVNDDGITARYENGILHLNIPKREEAKKKGTKLIQIN